MSQLTNTTTTDRDIITIENTLADPLESPNHHYDLPSELITADKIHHMPWSDVPRQMNYINMQTAASSVSGGSMSQISKTYDSPSELGTVSLECMISTLIPIIFIKDIVHAHV